MLFRFFKFGAVKILTILFGFKFFILKIMHVQYIVHAAFSIKRIILIGQAL